MYATTKIDKALSLLGLARRAKCLLIGQDEVFGATEKDLLILLTEDCANQVLRKVEKRLSWSASACYRLSGVSRERLGCAIGIQQVQIVALAIESGFANNLSELLQQGA